MNINEIESFLSRINSIICSRLVLENDVIKELHIVSDTKRSPKQISRDIQSVLISQFNIDIDYKMISIAQIENRESLLNDYRLKISGIEHTINGSLFESKVTLEKDNQFFVGTHSGINTSKNVHKIVATSTLNAVADYFGNSHFFVLDDVYKVRSSENDTFVSIVTTVMNNQEQTLCGSTLLQNNDNSVAVEATLDAINRIMIKFDK